MGYKVKVSPMLSLSVIFLTCRTAFGDDFHIKTYTDFATLSENAAQLSGSTVFIDNDIDFLGNSLSPLGTGSRPFQGTFDGQGYVVSELKMTSSSNYVGLFGYSTGLTIKNVILDNTCSVKSMHSGSSNAYIGSIVSCCGSTTITTTATVDIESIVNLAGITLEGSYKGSYVGGIVGATYTSANGMLIKNCVNYGAISVKASGSTLGYTDIGGIIGCTDKSNGNIQNCLNYGILNYDGSAGDTSYIGGIAGYSQGSNYTNCVWEER